MVKSKIHVRGGGRESVPSLGFLQDDVVPNFHIPPFLPLSRCDLVYFNVMAYGTQHDTKSVHHPVVHLRSRRLRLTRLQVRKGQSDATKCRIVYYESIKREPKICYYLFVYYESVLLCFLFFFFRPLGPTSQCS